MPNPTLTPEQLVEAQKVLGEVRDRLKVLAGDDQDLLFAYRRKIAKELGYDERSKPEKRKRLKAQMRRFQEGKCADCKGELPTRGSVLDRREAKGGYTKENVELVCPACDFKRQDSRRFM